jgi:hypothetical protein
MIAKLGVQRLTPPRELVDQWVELWQRHARNQAIQSMWYIATQAAQWGADQELEACCEWFQEFYKTESWVKHDLKHFRDARRPKPPSLKEQALAQTNAILNDPSRALLTEVRETLELNRRALEALDD